jgi:hypothetical protein
MRVCMCEPMGRLLVVAGWCCVFVNGCVCAPIYIYHLCMYMDPTTTNARTEDAVAEVLEGGVGLLDGQIEPQACETQMVVIVMGQMALWIQV